MKGKTVKKQFKIYKLRFRDVKPSLNQGEDIFPQHKDTVSLKEPDLYCFLLRCEKPKAEPFMEWVVETVLPREVRKLASAVEEKDATIALMNDDLQDRDNQIQAIKYKNVALQAARDAYQAGLSYKNVKISSPIWKHVMFLMQKT